MMQQLMQKNLLEKAFFGHKNCLKVQFSLNKDCYFQFGKEIDDSWIWKKVKFNDVELGYILCVLSGRMEKTSFYHKFKDQATQIWINRVNDSIIIKTKEISKSLNPGEQEVMKVLIERIILQNNIPM